MKKYVSPYWNSYDGKKWFNEDRHVLCGSYYFLGTERIEHQRKVYQIMALLSEVGGLAGGVAALTSFFCTEVTFLFVV